MGKPTIRRAEQRDFASILKLAEIVTVAGDTFPWEGTCDEEETALLSETWLPELGRRREVFVCEVDEFAGIAGAYVLHPIGLGRRGHIAQGAYMVVPGLRGRGLGKQLCAHSLREAQKRRYTSMQFDTVVATNIAAVKVFTSCGFKIMCTLPKVFEHLEQGCVDAHVLFHDFSSMDASTPSQRRLSQASAAPELQSTFGYPAVKLTYSIGDEVHLLPQALPPAEQAPSPSNLPCHFKVEPPLPEGLVLCPLTGTVQGAPARACKELTYHITSRAISSVTFQVSDTTLSRETSHAAMVINEDFVAQLMSIATVEELPREPARTRTFGDWMAWMVHRAHLNDPTLIEFNFNNMHMPLPHLETRIGPKLMKAMETNTHIEVLSLSNSNVQKSTGLELADALRRNCTLRTLNLEGNCLDSNSIRELALGIAENTSARLEHLRLQHQRMGPVFGRPAEEAVGQMMQRNETVVKLGFECEDAHWRNLMDRALVRNNDFRRRRSQAALLGEEEELDAPSEERTLGPLVLQNSPKTIEPSDFFSESNPCHGPLRAYMAQNLRLPTPSQLQHYAKNSGAPMSYTLAAPLIRECRAWMLDNVLSSEVVVNDAFELPTAGIFKSWKESGEHWTVDLLVEAGGRLTFRADREPAVFLSPMWTPWLNRTKSSFAGA